MYFTDDKSKAFGWDIIYRNDGGKQMKKHVFAMRSCYIAMLLLNFLSLILYRNSSICAVSFLFLLGKDTVIYSVCYGISRRKYSISNPTWERDARKISTRKKGIGRTAKEGRNGQMELIVPFLHLLDNKI